MYFNTMELLILALFVLTAGFSVILFKMKKRIDILESHLDVTMTHSQMINDVFQKSITIIKDALIDFDSRITLNRSVIMASVDNNKITAETRIANLETIEKNNKSILQQEIRTVRGMVDKMREDLTIQIVLADEINEEISKFNHIKNKVEGYLSSLGKKLLPPHKK